jgi:hypothetical protein
LLVQDVIDGQRNDHPATLREKRAAQVMPLLARGAAMAELEQVIALPRFSFAAEVDGLTIIALRFGEKPHERRER